MCRIDGYRLNFIDVLGKEPISSYCFHILRLKYSPILRLEESVVNTNDFLDQLDNEIYNAPKGRLRGLLWVEKSFNIIIIIIIII